MSSLYLVFFTKIASTTGFIVVASIVLICLLTKRRVRNAQIFFFTTAGLMFATELLKNWFRVPRPTNVLIEASGYALPSGHAAGSMFLAIALSYFAKGLSTPLRYGVYAAGALTTLAIGASRFQLGVHTPFQILFGYVLGALFAGICIVAIKHY
ncbi:phosphatase PAP2 family protein [Patescibacteria group bacterium]|nr:phosphatase PAP2 family protein [Patescibacteria group bacterium]